MFMVAAACAKPCEASPVAAEAYECAALMQCASSRRQTASKNQHC